ncbi:uncharacterized protein LY89DRAFT_208156 [Mollisia scopiformis]|uniref:Uncharacterized protein n=1 Tax=Mollisia scopiformis TaxID=149040 RepID=A0A194WXQ9_MOLSC|nr:uncharacterized protein LY89DRAFT_208156 [Mollisia scopiformis]KUJ12469.1 hypothetical protein LY89DRAFT_208156 [Mollisia scopiformis]
MLLRPRWGCWSLHKVTSLCIRRSRGFSTRERWVERDVERYHVACGSSGSITVDLHNPQVLTNPTTPLILYLPPTGTHLRSTHRSIPSSLLSSFPLLQINYRWNTTPSVTKYLASHPSFKNHAFPTPLHDIHHAYTHLTTTILPRYTSSPPTSPLHNSYRYSPPAFPRLKTPQRPLIIYGSFLGGALATSFALTESRTSLIPPVRIAGLVVRDGVFDFSQLALLEGPSSSPGSCGNRGGCWDGGNWDSHQLHRMKKILFDKPASTFDSFASPIFFLRTPGVEIPKFWPGEDDSSSSSAFSQEEDIWVDGDGESLYVPSPASPAYSTSTGTQTGDQIVDGENINGDEKPSNGKTITTLETQKPPAKALLKFPPSYTDLILPRSLFLYTSPTSSPSPTSTSASKLASLTARRKPKPTSNNQTPTDHNPNLKAELGLGPLHPKAQTTQITTLLRRSIVVHESKTWSGRDGDGDGDRDPGEVAEERIQVLELGGADSEAQKKSGEDEAVGRWIADIYP